MSASEGVAVLGPVGAPEGGGETRRCHGQGSGTQSLSKVNKKG